MYDNVRTMYDKNAQKVYDNVRTMYDKIKMYDNVWQNLDFLKMYDNVWQNYFVWQCMTMYDKNRPKNGHFVWQNS